MVFKNGVKDIQAAAYNGAHTVLKILPYIPQSTIFLKKRAEGKPTTNC